MDSEIQIKLLRALEEKEIARLGGNRKIKIDIQLVAATNKDLEKAVADGAFREDLYFRLKGEEIHLPLLSSRRDDIPLLCKHFLRHLKEDGRTSIERVSDEAMGLLLSYDWPGNVRELKLSIERAVLFAHDYNHQEIMPDGLSYEIRTGKAAASGKMSVEIAKQGIDIDEELARLELAYIEQALKMAGGKKTEAWKIFRPRVLPSPNRQ
ncbi:MAG: sigma 54-interacting transcriptional regulator [bacterium]|nr:sigma 54-interacting transcriptional regulator [bacterium]